MGERVWCWYCWNACRHVGETSRRAERADNPCPPELAHPVEQTPEGSAP